MALGRVPLKGSIEKEGREDLLRIVTHTKRRAKKEKQKKAKKKTQQEGDTQLHAGG